jgi:hypothetical protein
MTCRDRRTSHPEHRRWYNMMARCYSSTNRKYHRYGGRGITVHADWHDPWIFFHYLDTVLGPCPPGHSLDRIDNDGDYAPGNVRWGTHSEQQANRSDSFQSTVTPRQRLKKMTPEQRVMATTGVDEATAAQVLAAVRADLGIKTML